ncbi:hypothetical protein SMACR_04676 [Sordaria macrospora]|uniref:WGS project CABT00000000 data, contig 2.21 n=2 Tax=Sordaria macrospora TaxID=5147 RepID=F7W243_SORMK|nr:uncharacterized protein SMAC_04676 [Sordaria macrospora k-hell]KAA8632256.1 hypothetical protein SMACR_04676 [Sordaria macrospora]KAH7630940.1 hypothetical protein B0T09DRAFT_127211 [Sordaria sp. MPI-SDFR-AT-0083]WPJ61947.1 hypothetical protein SMAC4_04676 [Sordaria macrospora]CCC11693.1 unnamed protein product [Sordaria macrospora k-hell]
MAIWPFRRKSRKRRSRAATTDFDGHRDATPIGQASAGGQAKAGTDRSEPHKLQRRARTYSFSPGRHDSIVLGRKPSVEGKRRVTGPAATFQGPASTDLGRNVFFRVPTLHNKRDGDDLLRKKSSKKRRREDRAREAEIKAMSTFVPVRAATEDWMAGRPMKKDSKRFKNGLGFRGQRSSEVSLPVPGSLDSALSSDSEQISYKVSALNALAPRPTLRYATHPRQGSTNGEVGASPLAKKPSQRQKTLVEPIPEATLKAHKRVDDLANDLSASDLRELMERDRRRRERRLQREQENAQTRLAKRVEKQRADDAEAQEEGRESPPNLERGVLGREAVGLGIDPESAVVTSSRIRESDELSRPVRKRSREEFNEGKEEEHVRPHPLRSFHRTESIPVETPTSPLGSLASPHSRSSFFSPNGRSSRQASLAKTEHSEQMRRGSETSSSRGPLSWASIFRWGNRNRRSSGGPSSFSNTSRDSMQNSMQTPQLQVPTPPINFTPRRVSLGVPKHTKSRFREDLPELPLLPPGSRIHLNENDSIPPTIAEASPNPNQDVDPLGVAISDGARDETPTSSEQRFVDALRHTPSSFGHPDERNMTPEPHTMSLASIDSEASWLSGRLSAKRRKSSSIMRSSTPYKQLPRTSEPDDENEEEHLPEHENLNEESIIVDDDYLSRVARASGERPGWNRQSSGEARASSDWEEEPHWGSVREGQPVVIHDHPANVRTKSFEGYLNSLGDTPEASPGLSETMGEAKDEEIRRATSVNLGKGHARHISAGSARLLSLSPRNSTDKRRSLPPRPLDDSAARVATVEKQ